MPLLLASVAAEAGSSYPQAVAEAARRLAAGSLVAFPTETVYGLGARADDDAAVARIFAAKGRPSDHPLIVHVAGADEAAAFAAEVPDTARRLMQAFWPGPLTVIVPRRAGLAAAAAGAQATIGLRCPDHPLARALLHAAHAAGVPGVAAPSANRFGRISPTRAEHVMAELADLPEAELAVLDGGPCRVGIESAIVDCTVHPPALLRPGSLTREAIATVLADSPGEVAAALGERTTASPRASGTLQAHYAPRARLRLMDEASMRSALELIGSDLTQAPGADPVLALYSRCSLERLLGGSRRPPPGMLHRTMPGQAEAAASELFAALRDLDDQGVRLIWVEAPPGDSAWEGVRDRLARAAAAG